MNNARVAKIKPIKEYAAFAEQENLSDNEKSDMSESDEEVDGDDRFRTTNDN